MAANQVRGDLPSSLTASYNGFTFSPSMECTGCSIKNVYDRANRTVVRKVFSLSIKDRLQSDTGLEGNATTSFGAVRKALEQPGGTLHYENTGLGGKEVNGGVKFNITSKDLEWGPRPQLLQWRQLGAGNAIEFIWNVEWSTLDAYQADTGIMEFNYTLAFSISSAGITKRTYAGYLRIAQTRNGVTDRTLKDNADKYVASVVPPLLNGFRRIPGERSIDEAKCTMDFSIVDEELPSTNVPPPGCINASATHNLETDSVSMLSWHGSIDASYELVKGVTPGQAMLYFINLVQDRLAEAQAKAQAQAVIPIKLSIREGDLYGPPRASFSLAYTYTSTLGGILGAHGLWRPATDSDWKEWSKSLAGSAFAPRGIAGLLVNNSDDTIVDLGNQNTTRPKTQPANINEKGDLPDKLNFFKAPPEEKSWVDYQMKLVVLAADETATLKPLPQAAIATKAIAAAIYDPVGAVKGFIADYANGQAVAAINQKRTHPTYFVDLVGRAIRAGFDIRKPQLVLFAGANATPQNVPPMGFRQGIVANWGGIPIYAAKWHLRFVLDRAPGDNQATATVNVPNLIYTAGKVK